jgi:hypothetical protein
MRKILGSLCGLVLVFGTISCGGDSTAPGGGGGGGGGGNNCPANTFCMGSSIFFTAAGTTVTTLSVPANTAVTWTNGSGTLHDVAFDDPSTALAVGAGGSGNIGQHSSGSNQRQFAVSGSSHPFHCQIHGTPMHGTVTVQ